MNPALQDFVCAENVICSVGNILFKKGIDINALLCYNVTHMEVIYESDSYHKNTR
jgi:hypothetical protein